VSEAAKRRSLSRMTRSAPRQRRTHGDDDHLAAVALLELKPHFESVEVFRIEDGGEGVAVDGSVGLHHLARDVLRIRHLFGKHNDSQGHIPSLGVCNN